MRDLYVRKKIRLENYDYSQAGCYFVTICAKCGYEMFGNIVGATDPGRPCVQLTALGECIGKTIQYAEKDGLRIAKYVIMPNHIHMLIILTTGDRGRSPLQDVIRNIKAYVTEWAGFSPWQKSFYDHIVRSKAEYMAIWKYIDENPSKWEEDRYYKMER